MRKDEIKNMPDSSCDKTDFRGIPIPPKKLMRRAILGAMNPVNFLIGWCVISIDATYVGEFLNLCMAKKYAYRNLTAYGKGDGRRVMLACSAPVLRKLERDWNNSDPGSNNRRKDRRIFLERSIGIPHIFYRYRHRYGIFAGIIIMLTIIYASCGFLWDIRISGNDNLSDIIIMRELNAKGLCPGKRISQLDIDRIENAVLLDSDDISWITINLNGTVAHVQIREKNEQPPKKETKPSNLIASKNGEIVSLEVFSGKPVVKPGDIVTKGDLLVSGIYDSQSMGYRFRHSSGAVYARTTQTFEIEIPFRYQKKEYTGRIISDNNLIFFSNIIKLSENSGNLPSKYDTINRTDVLTLVRGKNLPVILESTQYLEYVMTDAERDATEASELAFRELEYRLSEITENTYLLNKSITVSADDSCFRLTCRLMLIENIADMLEIDFDFN